MNLRSLDLNLLVVLDALLDEAHVSRAADRLCLSQPATSAALQRCRHIFRDELLERGRGTMYLTPKAKALRAPLQSLLNGVVDLIDPSDVPLAEIRQTLRIAIMADYPALFIVAPLQGSILSSSLGMAPTLHARRSWTALAISHSRSSRHPTTIFIGRRCWSSTI